MIFLTSQLLRQLRNYSRHSTDTSCTELRPLSVWGGMECCTECGSTEWAILSQPVLSLSEAVLSRAELSGAVLSAPNSMELASSKWVSTESAITESAST